MRLLDAVLAARTAGAGRARRTSGAGSAGLPPAAPGRPPGRRDFLTRPRPSRSWSGCGSTPARRRGLRPRHRAAAGVILPAGAAAHRAPPGPPPPGPPPGPRGLLDEAETFAILRAAAAGLARGAEALGRATAPAAGLILVAEARVLAGGHALEALRHDLALVDPDLDADAAVGRLRLGEAVVDVGADRVQRDAALGVALRAAHLAAAEAAAALDLDPLGARAHRRGQRALHRAAEADAVLQLLGDRLGDELRVQLGPLDLVDVDVDVLARDRVQLLAERVDLDAGLADHDPGAGGEDVDRDPLLVLADQDVGQAGVAELRVDVVADLDVLEDVLRELLLPDVPVGLPVVDDADPQAAGMHLLAHQATASFFFARDCALRLLSGCSAASAGAGASVVVGRGGARRARLPGLRVLRELDRDVARALEDLVDAAARARAPALQRRALVGVGGLDDQVVAVPVQERVRLGVRDGRAQHLLDVLGGRALREGEDRPRLGHAAPADVREHDPRLARREADPLGLRAHDLLRLSASQPLAALLHLGLPVAGVALGTSGWERTRRACARPSAR